MATFDKKKNAPCTHTPSLHRVGRCACAAAQVFRANSNFVTYWTTDVDDSSSWEAAAPPCDPAAMLALIKSDVDYPEGAP